MKAGSWPAVALAEFIKPNLVARVTIMRQIWFSYIKKKGKKKGGGEQPLINPVLIITVNLTQLFTQGSL